MDDYDLSLVPGAKRKQTLDRIRALDRHLDDPLAPPASELAAGLGMSTNTFHMLARIWRANKRPEALADPYNLSAARLSNETPVEANDVDLALVAPDRREEIVRRITVMERFLTGGAGTAEGHAAELGVHVKVFYRMVRIWKATGRPEALPGSGAPRTRRDSFMPEQSELVARAISEFDHASVATIQKRANELAKREGVRLPVYTALSAKIRSMVGGRLPPGSWAEGCDLVVDHCAIDNGFVDEAGKGVGNTGTMPVATVLLDVAAAKAVGVSLSAEAGCPSAVARAISDAASRELGRRGDAWKHDGARRTLALTVLPGASWSELEAAVGRGGLHVQARRRPRVGRATAAVDLLGPQLAGLHLRSSLADKPAAARPASGRSTLPAMSLRDLEQVVRERWLPAQAAPGPLASLSGDQLRRLERLGDPDAGFSSPNRSDED